MQNTTARRFLLIIGSLTIIGLVIAIGFTFTGTDTAEVDPTQVDDENVISQSALIYQNSLMSISYEADPDTGLKASDDTIIIDASASYRAAALRLLISQEISPAEHHITFTGAEDAFADYD